MSETTKGVFKIKADPTFEATAEIHTPGGKPQALKLTFRHKTKEELHDFFYGDHPNRKDLDAVMEVVAGWTDVEVDFSREAMGTVLSQYPKSAQAILAKYAEELSGARAKN